MRILQLILYVLNIFLYWNLLFGAFGKSESKIEVSSKKNIKNYDNNVIFPRTGIMPSRVLYDQQYKFDQLLKRSPTKLLGDVENRKTINSVHDESHSLNLSPEQFKIGNSSEKSIALKPYSMIDADIVAQKYPVQSIQKGKEIRFDDSMNQSVHAMIEELQKSTQYKNIAMQIPEIFATYVVEFMRVKIDQNNIFTKFQGLFRSNNSFEWILSTQDSRFNWFNLSMGMDVLNSLCEQFKVYDKVVDSKNLWMVADMDKYLQALRERYVHVPDKILAMYVTAFLNDSKYHAYNIKSSVVSAVQNPILILPDELASMKENKILSDALDKPLSLFQKLYLTIEAIENINKNNNQYVSIVNKDIIALEPKVPLEDRINLAIETPGSKEGFLLRSGVAKAHIEDPTLQEIEQAQTNLEDNYPSYNNFKNNSQDRKAFEQLQLDFINLNQDILAISNTLPVNKNISSLIEINLDFSKRINELIIHQKYIDFIDSFLPSVEKNISYDEMTNQFYHFKDSINSNVNTFFQQYLKPQNDKVVALLTPVVTGIEPKIKDISMKVLQSEIDGLKENISSFVEVGKEVNQLETIKRNEDEIIPIMKALNRLDFFESCMNQVSDEQKKIESKKVGIDSKDIYIMKGVFGEFALNLKNVQVEYESLKNQAEFIVDKNLKNSSLNDVVIKTLEQFKTACFENFNFSKPKNIVKTIDTFIDLYNQVSFEKQDIGQITLGLIDLLIQYPDNKIFALYNQVFIELHMKLQPEQIKLEKISKINDGIQQYLTMLTKNKIPLNVAIDKITAAMVEFQKNKTEIHFSAAVNRLNKELDTLLSQYSENMFSSRTNYFEPGLIKSGQDLVNLYEDLLASLKSKQQEEIKQTALYQFTQSFMNGLNNIGMGNISEVKSDAVGLATNFTGVVGEVNGQLTMYVSNVLGPIKSKLSQQALDRIANVLEIAAVYYIQVQLSAPSEDQKKVKGAEVLAAMMADVKNIVVADQTGADINIVASNDLQAIATSGLFNKAINLLVPDEQETFSQKYSVHDQSDLGNLEKFKAENYYLLNNHIQPLRRNAV